MQQPLANVTDACPRVLLIGMAVESTEGLVIADLPPRRRLADRLAVRWLLRDIIRTAVNPLR